MIDKFNYLHSLLDSTAQFKEVGCIGCKSWAMWQPVNSNHNIQTSKSDVQLKVARAMKDQL